MDRFKRFLNSMFDSMGLSSMKNFLEMYDLKLNIVIFIGIFLIYTFVTGVGYLLIITSPAVLSDPSSLESVKFSINYRWEMMFIISFIMTVVMGIFDEIENGHRTRFQKMLEEDPELREKIMDKIMRND